MNRMRSGRGAGSVGPGAVQESGSARRNGEGRPAPGSGAPPAGFCVLAAALRRPGMPASVSDAP
ncbi:MAG: hypothetical protein ACK48N_14920, partial [Planctomyces sp.]